MKKLSIAALAGVAALALAGPASAQEPPVQSVKITANALPVPITQFDGEYQRADGSTGFQEGYVKVHVTNPGVEACNGSPALTHPQTGEALQGYIWVGGPNPAPNELVGTGDGTAGAGSGDLGNDDVYGPGESPCPDGHN